MIAAVYARKSTDQHSMRWRDKKSIVTITTAAGRCLPAVGHFIKERLLTMWYRNEWGRWIKYEPIFQNILVFIFAFGLGTIFATFFFQCR